MARVEFDRGSMKVNIINDDEAIVKEYDMYNIPIISCLEFKAKIQERSEINLKIIENNC